MGGQAHSTYGAMYIKSPNLRMNLIQANESHVLKLILFISLCRWTFFVPFKSLTLRWRLSSWGAGFQPPPSQNLWEGSASRHHSAVISTALQLFCGLSSPPAIRGPWRLSAFPIINFAASGLMRIRSMSITLKSQSWRHRNLENVSWGVICTARRAWGCICWVRARLNSSWLHMYPKRSSAYVSLKCCGKND